MAHPDSADAWKGLISTLQSTNHTNEAIQQIAYIPPAVRSWLETDPQFVQAEASLYAAAGDTVRATEYMNRVNAYYSRLGQPAACRFGHSERMAALQHQERPRPSIPR